MARYTRSRGNEYTGNNRRIVGCVILYAVHVIPKESGQFFPELLVLILKVMLKSQDSYNDVESFSQRVKAAGHEDHSYSSSAQVKNTLHVCEVSSLHGIAFLCCIGDKLVSCI
jgi:hypothetical protein